MSRDPDRGSGAIFLTPGTRRRGGLMILNASGQLVWFRSVTRQPAGKGNPPDTNLEVQSYRGQPVLTWWQGAQEMILDRSYRTVAVVRAGKGWVADPHDFVITPQGTAWLVATRNERADLSSVGGQGEGILHDEAVQEIDIATGRVLWQWDARHHIPFNASYAGPSNGYYPAYHLNSIQVLPGGDLLVSSRNTWSVYKIDIRTKRILWTLGGKYNDFTMGSGTGFEWQHAAHLAGRTLTVFDDADAPQEEPQSSAKVIRLNFPARAATLVHAYTHSPAVLTPSQGNAQRLPNGNLFVGWGAVPEFSEYTPAGRQILNGSFAFGLQSYRALRFHWYAQPSTRPSIAVARRSGGRASVWASWNGATSVAWWRVLGGSTSGNLHRLTGKRRYSFETQITLHTRPNYVEVQAIGGRGRVLGTSAVRSLAGSRHVRRAASGRAPRASADRRGDRVRAGAARSGGGKFHSAPGLHPPVVRVKADPDTGSGDIFLTPERSFQAGPMILNSHGQLVWFHPVRFTQEFAAFNLEVQRYRGRPVLTWWRGTISGASPRTSS